MTSLALGGLVIRATSSGAVQVGGSTVPAWMAQDLALRLWEAAGDIPAAQRSRLAVRHYVDGLGPWKLCSYRNVETRQIARGSFLPIGELVGWLRVSDTVTCLVRREGAVYARGCGLAQWREDTLLGMVFDHVDLTTRLSVRWQGPKRIGGDA